MFCKKCGFRLDDDANFCPKCGTTVSDDIKNRVSQQTDTAEKENTYAYELSRKDMFDFNVQLYNNYISGEQELVDKLGSIIDSILKAVIPACVTLCIDLPLLFLPFGLRDNRHLQINEDHYEDDA